MKQPRIGISVIICCHNSAERLPATLQHLADQQVSPNIHWEILLVDNASTDDTLKIIKTACPDSILNRMRIISEPRTGQSFARLSGIRAASHDIISFIDDDNWVSNSWIANIYELFTQNSVIDVVGGPTEGVYEQEPPPWFHKIKAFYAVGNQHSTTGEVTWHQGTILWGAGMTIRRSALLSLLDCGFEFLSTGRKGNLLTSGEDAELGFALRAMGCRFYYDERLKLRHYITSPRLTWKYAKNLFFGMGMSSTILNIYCAAFRLCPFDSQPSYKRTWTFQIAKYTRKIIQHILRNPLSFLTESEGSENYLIFQSYLGAIFQLINIRDSYEENVRKLQTARWNVVRPEPSRSYIRTRKASSLRWPLLIIALLYFTA